MHLIVKEFFISWAFIKVGGFWRCSGITNFSNTPNIIAVHFFHSQETLPGGVPSLSRYPCIIISQHSLLSSYGISSHFFSPFNFLSVLPLFVYN